MASAQHCCCRRTAMCQKMYSLAGGSVLAPFFDRQIRTKVSWVESSRIIEQCLPAFTFVPLADQMWTWPSSGMLRGGCPAACRLLCLQGSQPSASRWCCGWRSWTSSAPLWPRDQRTETAQLCICTAFWYCIQPNIGSLTAVCNRITKTSSLEPDHLKVMFTVAAFL